MRLVKDSDPEMQAQTGTPGDQWAKEHQMVLVECPICLRDVQIAEDARDGDVMQCPVCKVWFKLVRVNGEWEGIRI